MFDAYYKEDAAYLNGVDRVVHPYDNMNYFALLTGWTESSTPTII